MQSITGDDQPHDREGKYSVLEWMKKRLDGAYIGRDGSRLHLVAHRHASSSIGLDHLLDQKRKGKREETERSHPFLPNVFRQS